MNMRTSKLAAIALIIAIASMFAFNAAAAAPAGTSPYDALSPGGTAMTLDAGQSHWYAFQYNGGGSRIMIQLWGNAQFGVWTKTQVDAWARGDSDVEPVGRGASDAYEAGDLSWTGSFNVAGTYYINVENNGTAVTTYTLKASGAEVSYPQPAAQAVTTTSSPVSEQPAAAAEPAAPAKTGSGPDDALTADGLWKQIGVGQSHWYAFQYNGDQSQILVRMHVSPSAGASFSVWTPAQVAQWAAGDKVDPIGRGADDNYAGGPSWSGNFNAAGTYYVEVESSGEAPGYYSLTIDF